MSKQRTNQEWLNDLTSSGEVQAEALADLSSIIKKGLPFALEKWLPRSDPKFDDLVEEVTQDTVIRVLDKLHTFQGRSKLTTWVHKIAIRIALTELRRKRWQESSLDDLLESEKAFTLSIDKDQKLGPEKQTEQSDMLAFVKKIILTELTDQQRMALVAIAIEGMPLEEVARRMNTNRNALYKLIHDARKKLKAKLTQKGFSPEEILATFDKQ